MEIKELGHLVLYVHDVARSSAFYRDVLGWHQISPEGLPVAAFSSGRTHHELLLIEVGGDAAPLPAGRHVGLYHFGLKIGDTDEDLRTALGALKAAGVPIAGAADHTVSHSLYLFDPDGNEIELYVDVAGVDWANHPESILAPVRPLAL
ncbi:MAG: catechol 2,3-dioxygenase [Acidimicrobiaceae bacterium]|jgi:catechol-2,3-dioxygenase|nr:catechol 2,3-dioxygenase [Acidimicrobiaceae bacterium]